jgi:hypothetical protein
MLVGNARDARVGNRLAVERWDLTVVVGEAIADAARVLTSRPSGVIDDGAGIEVCAL